jgi:hypothetical protein
MQTDKILLEYLRSNGVATIAGPGDVLSEADTEVNDSDKTVLDKLQDNIGNKDIYFIVMLVCLVIVFAVLVYMTVKKINDPIKAGGCISAILGVIAMMHRIWRDKERSRNMNKVLPLLDKKDRLKVILAVLDKKGEVSFTSLVSGRSKKL